MKLDEKLFKLRKERGFTQLQLAEILKVSRQAVSRWEMGLATPSTENLKSISKLYNVPLDYLLNENEEVGKNAEPLTAEEPLSKENATEEKLAIPKSQKNRKKAVIFLAVTLVAALLAVLVFTELYKRASENSKDTVLYEEMSNEIVETPEGSDFFLEW